MIRAVALAVLLAACGSSHTAPAAPAPATQPTMSPEMTKLHGDLAPRWQEAPGPQRMKDTCGLDSACQTIDPATFDPAFVKVRDAFDALSAAAGTPKM